MKLGKTYHLLTIISLLMILRKLSSKKKSSKMSVTSRLKKYPDGTLWINQAKTKNIYSLNQKYFVFIIRKTGSLKHLRSQKTGLSISPKFSHNSPVSITQYYQGSQETDSQYESDSRYISSKYHHLFCKASRSCVSLFVHTNYCPGMFLVFLTYRGSDCSSYSIATVKHKVGWASWDQFLQPQSPFGVYLNKACTCLMNFTSCKTSTFTSIPTRQPSSCCKIPRWL